MIVDRLIIERLTISFLKYAARFTYEISCSFKFPFKK